MLNPLRAVAILVAALLSLATAALLVNPQPRCAVTVERLGSRTVPLQQQLVRVIVSPTCVRPGYAAVRYRTAEGGILPPIGYLKLRPDYPREDRHWLRPGARVEVQREDGRWIIVWRSGG